MRPVTETRLRVRYAETDQMGVVYYANYFVWMEVGRVDLAKRADSTTAIWSATTAFFSPWPKPIAATNRPAKFDDEVIVKTWIEDANTRIVIFNYEMRVAEDDRLLATGMTRHVFVNHQMQRSRMPEKYYPMFGIESTGR